MADAFKNSFNQFANKKQEILSKIADAHEERVINTLKNLEDEIIADLTSITDGGVKLNTRIAMELRPNLKRLIEKNFLKEADSIVSEYDEIVKEYQRFIKPLPIPDRFKTLTKPDLKVINDLKMLSFSGFEDVGNRFLDTIANEVYQSSVTGRPFNEMVKNIRGQISGVYQRSNENAVNRLVDYIDKNRYSENAQIIERVKKAREVLHTKYASDILGNNMRRYAGQIAQDSLMQFDGQFTLYKGKEAGITKFQYVGTNITTTRNFCRRYLDRVFTEEEARSIWQQSWRGKSGTDPFVNRGGYRCRHSFILYDDDWFTEETNDNIKEQTKTNDKQRKEQAKKKTQPIVVNKSSLANKIKIDDIQPLTKTYLINKLSKQFQQNANDSRYLKDEKGQYLTRFSKSTSAKNEGRLYYGRIELDNKQIKIGKLKKDFSWSETDFGVIEAMMQEMDNLAIKYGVPKLRGINSRAGRNQATMGDGVININVRYLTLNSKGNKSVNWKKGDPEGFKPQLATSYFDNQLDKIRSIWYHEFAHHIHQQKFVKTIEDYKKPLLEKKLKKIGKFRKNSSTQYADWNSQEWFAENFTLYELGKTELVDPKFIKFFEENVL